MYRFHVHALRHAFRVSASFSSTAGFGGAQESEAGGPQRWPWRLLGMRTSYFMSFSMHMPHAMPRARTCEAHARSVCASSVRWHALLGAQVPVRVLFFACTLFGMLENDSFHMHAACHAKHLPCRRARPHLRAGARVLTQARSGSVRHNTGTV